LIHFYKRKKRCHVMCENKILLGPGKKRTMEVAKSYLELTIQELKTVLMGVYNAVIYKSTTTRDVLRQQLFDLMSSDEDCSFCGGKCDVSSHHFSVERRNDAHSTITLDLPELKIDSKKRKKDEHLDVEPDAKQARLDAINSILNNMNQLQDENTVMVSVDDIKKECNSYVSEEEVEDKLFIVKHEELLTDSDYNSEVKNGFTKQENIEIKSEVEEDNINVKLDYGTHGKYQTTSTLVDSEESNQTNKLTCLCCGKYVGLFRPANYANGCKKHILKSHPESDATKILFEIEKNKLIRLSDKDLMSEDTTICFENKNENIADEDENVNQIGFYHPDPLLSDSDRISAYQAKMSKIEGKLSKNESTLETFELFVNLFGFCRCPNIVCRLCFLSVLGAIKHVQRCNNMLRDHDFLECKYCGSRFPQFKSINKHLELSHSDLPNYYFTK